MCLYTDKSIQPHFLAPESHVRNHAYHLWENAGKPHDKCFWDDAEKECNYIIAYKVVLKGDSRYGGEHNTLISPIQGMTWKQGWNESSRKPDEPHEPAALVFLGIHVFLDPWEAKQVSDAIPESHVLTVHCYENDFIAAGTCSVNWKTYDGLEITTPVAYKSAVFQKVFAPSLL